MKIKTSICFLLLLTNFIFLTRAQECNIEWGKEGINKFGKPQYHKFLGNYKGEIYKFCNNVDNIIETYDLQDLRLLSSNKILIPDFGDKNSTSLNQLFLLDGQLILIFDQVVTKSNAYTRKLESSYKCYGTIIDKNGKPRVDPVLLHEDLQKNTYSPTKCSAIMSQDSSIFFFYSGNITDSKIRGKLINKNLATITSNELEMNFERSYSLSNFMLDKNKILYCLSKEVLPETDWFSKKLKKYTNRVMFFNLNDNKSKKQLIPVKVNQPLTSFHMELHEENIHIVAYHYTGSKHDATGGGVIYYQFKASNLELVNSAENEFTSTTISQLNANVKLPNANSFDKTTNAINSLYNTTILPLKNGDKIIVSEQVVALDGSTYYGDNYFNILINRIDKNGNVVQNTVVPKIQAGLTKSFYSFVQFYKNNTLCFLFNDNPKNLNLQDPYKLDGGVAAEKGTIVVLVTVPENGNWTKKLLYQADNTTPNLYPKECFNMKNGIIIYGQKGNNIKLAKINY